MGNASHRPLCDPVAQRRPFYELHCPKEDRIAS